MLGRNYPDQFRTAPRPTQPSVQWVPAFFSQGHSGRSVALTIHPLMETRLLMGRTEPLSAPQCLFGTLRDSFYLMSWKCILQLFGNLGC